MDDRGLMQHAAEFPRELHPRPFARRVLVLSLAWNLGSGLLTWALQRAGGKGMPDYTLAEHLLTSLCVGSVGFALFGSLAYAVARQRWRRLADAPQRVHRHGLYGLLRWYEVVLVVLLLEPLVCVLGGLLMTSIHAWAWPAQPMPQPAPFAITLVWGYTSACLAGMLDYLWLRLIANEIRVETAQRQAAEAQLQRLQAQLEPHMLFNTLSNLHALIEADPQRAQAMLLRLIGFLRATLGASRTGAHPLRDEFERVADYLSLMQVRMGSRLQVVLDLPQALAGVAVPAMLLQPLAENAIKHGLEPSPEGGTLTVRAESRGGDLLLSVSDTGTGPRAASTATQAEGGGFGLLHVRDRLHTLYGLAASVQFAPAEGGGTCVLLRLPLQGASAQAAPALAARKAA